MNAAKAPGALWLTNVNRLGWNAVWEEALWHVYCAKWIVEVGVATEHLPALKAQVEWLLTHGGKDLPGGGFQVAFEVSTPDAATKTFQGSLSGGFWSQLRPFAAAWWPGRFDTRLDAALSTSFGSLPVNLRVDEPGLGPSCEKWHAILLHAMRR